MSLSTSIDLSELPPPSVVETLDYEALLDATKAELKQLAPELDVDDLPESDPISKILQVMAYRELHLRQRINEAAKEVMLATATGANLDNLAALVNIQRLEIEPGDPSASLDPVYESDERLRQRVQLAFEGFSTAGPQSAYIFHAMSASADVKDVAVYSDNPGEVEVRLLSSESDTENDKGQASPALITAVEKVLSSENVRPITDWVKVESAEIIDYSIEATLILFPGVGAQEVYQAAVTAAKEFAKKNHRLGVDITVAGVLSALYQPGVQNIDLKSPSSDIVIERFQAPYGTIAEGAIRYVEHPTRAPLNLAAYVTANTTTSDGKINGSVSITRATEEYDISYYVLYWGANNAVKLPNGVKRYIFDSDGILQLDHQNIVGLMITSDDGQTIYRDALDYTADTAAGIITAENSTLKSSTVRVRYSLPPIAEIAKENDLVYTFTADTDVPVGATHVVVFTKNEHGEMTQGVGVDISS
jgi:phage-related baseplate assembly protein